MGFTAVPGGSKLGPATAKIRPEAKFGVNMALLSVSRLSPPKSRNQWGKLALAKQKQGQKR
jgi:hypothetical protein